VTAPSKESRDAALARVSPHDYENIDAFITAVDRLARYIESGEMRTRTPNEIAADVQPHVTSSVTNVMNVR
jgi:hypothetical protein